MNRLTSAQRRVVNLTKRVVEKLEAPDPSGRQRLHWDAEVKGFGVLCSGKTNTKSYVAQKQIGRNTRRVTIAQTNVISPDEARTRAKAILGDFAKGIDPKAQARKERAERITLSEALTEYMKSKANVRKSSMDQYKKIIETYLKAWLNKPLNEINKSLVFTRYHALRAEVSQRRTPPEGKKPKRIRRSTVPAQHTSSAGAATANSVMRTFRAIWNFTRVRNDALPPCPTEALKDSWITLKKRERRVEDGQLKAFHDALCLHPNPVVRDALRLMLLTGMRRGEVCGLRFDECDFERRGIKLPEERTKAGRVLHLPMSDIVFTLLKERRKAEGDGAEFVFPSAHSKSGHVTELRFATDEIARKTDIKVSRHDLRRTFCSVAESCSLTPYELKALMNHSLGRDVTTGYVIITDVERLREPMQRVADRMKQLCGLMPDPKERAKCQGAQPRKLRGDNVVPLRRPRRIMHAKRSA